MEERAKEHSCGRAAETAQAAATTAQTNRAIIPAAASDDGKISIDDFSKVELRVGLR